MLASSHRLLVIFTTSHLPPLLRPESEDYRMMEEGVDSIHSTPLASISTSRIVILSPIETARFQSFRQT